MLQLKDIKKVYKTVGADVQALKGVTLRFRKNEFVSILGASGCGKTTLLNIIGGLDHYTSGDLVICGKSTKDYKDRDWDVYRNHRIGFVFQSYNLIPHQTVLGNVELALTIAGISKNERRQRAQEALEKVGLKDELHKRPNQLSGGQMQRVAIARALVNNPEILLADEPTGALDTATSIQIMELIREIAGERLVIMVTHNPELAQQYSSRIVKLSDGLVVSDSNPYDGEESAQEDYFNAPIEQEQTEMQPVAIKPKKKKKERSAMSFITSLGLSARNLLTKKGRTIITSFAGSIGIISVCLVLALSNGFNNYILKTEEDMLSSNPIEITETTVDIEAIMTGMTSADDMPDLSKIGDRVYVNSFLTNMAQGMTVTNDLSDEYITYIESLDKSDYAAIVYDTGMDLSNNIFTEVEISNVTGAETDTFMSLSAIKAYYTAALSEQDAQYAQLAQLVPMLGAIYGKLPGTTDVNGDEYLDYVKTQYELVGENSKFPTEYNQALLVIGQNNDVTDLTLAQLGLMDQDEFMSLFPTGDQSVDDLDDFYIDFDRVIGKQFVLKYNDDIYKADTTSKDYMYSYNGMRAVGEENAQNGIVTEIVGVVRLKDGLNYGCLSNGLYFTEQLYQQFLQNNLKSNVAKELAKQLEVTSTFASMQAELEDIAPGSEAFLQKTQQLTAYFMQNMQYMTKRVANTLDGYYGSKEMETGINDEKLTVYYLMGNSALRAVGGLDTVNAISIYAEDFDAKENILAHLDKWNDTHEREKQVRYTDMVGMMMTMVESMLNAITYVLVAFTAISLVVSSVMIGIITYVSVVERTKEIGVLRSLGARKKDIKNLFNAETFIIGLTSGVFGVGVTYLLSLGINALLGSLTGIATLASLKISSALIMIVVSFTLTIISGLIPARAAAKKDPVIALRTE
ncbi:MAG: ABC transporter ATP-binding protein/permease [Clostridia bacterium]|nr:ABC transporter ATP-binding protein/permease [Clostridia bacterium]